MHKFHLMRPENTGQIVVIVGVVLKTEQLRTALFGSLPMNLKRSSTGPVDASSMPDTLYPCLLSDLVLFLRSF